VEYEQNDSKLNIDDLVAAIKRRFPLLVLTMILVFSIIAIISLKLPKVYYSEASILVEKPDIPEELVDINASSYIIDRIEIFKKKLITKKNLQQLLGRLDLSETETSDSMTLLDIQEAISIEVVDVQSINSKSGKPSISTIGVTVGFEAETPRLTQLGANLVAEMVLQSHRKDREDKAAHVTTFLKSETERLGNELTSEEQQLAQFKQHNAQQLPNLLEVNMRMLEQTETKIDIEARTIQELEFKRSALIEKLEYLDPMLSTVTSQKKGVSLVDELNQLKTNKVYLSSIYSPEHPDVVNLESKILSLEKIVKQISSNAEVNNDIQQLKNSLVTLKLKYSNNHPDVISLKNALSRKEQLINNDVKESDFVQSYQSVSPEFTQVNNELRATKTGLYSAQKRKTEQLRKKEDYETRIFNTPVVEKEYLAITRTYQEKLEAYKQVNDKLLKARIAENIEKNQKNERLTLLESASLPLIPIRPNRLGIALLGGFLAFFCGICAATAAEFKDNSVRGIRDVLAIMEAPPLASIPTINQQVLYTSGGFIFLMVCLALAVSGLSLYLFNYYVI